MKFVLMFCAEGDETWTTADAELIALAKAIDQQDCRRRNHEHAQPDQQRPEKNPGADV